MFEKQVKECWRALLRMKYLDERTININQMDKRRWLQGHLQEESESTSAQIAQEIVPDRIG
jgi:hypothetical protein